MEKQRARLTELLESEASAFKGIDGIYVESVDIFKQKGLISIMLSGADSLEPDNDLACYLDKLNEYYKNTVNLIFTDISDLNGITGKIASLIKYQVLRDSDSEIIEQSCVMDLSCDEGKFDIILPGYWENLYSDNEIKEIKAAVCRSCKLITGIDPSDADGIELRVVYNRAGGDDVLSPEEIIRRAKENGTYYENDGNYEKPGKRKKKTEGQSDRVEEKEEEPKDKKLSTSSWEYKSQQGLKEAKEEEGGKKELRRPPNAEGAIFGRVKTDAKRSR